MTHQASILFVLLLLSNMVLGGINSGVLFMNDPDCQTDFDLIGCTNANSSYCNNGFCASVECSPACLSGQRCVRAYEASNSTGVCECTDCDIGMSCRYDIPTDISRCVPSNWTGSIIEYDNNDGCHCGRGVLDPGMLMFSRYDVVDCTRENQQLLGCADNDTMYCSASGQCTNINNCSGCLSGQRCVRKSFASSPASMCICSECAEGDICRDNGIITRCVPSGWTGNILEYDSNDGVCNCERGVLDPDCLNVLTNETSCGMNEYCNATGSCMRLACNCGNTNDMGCFARPPAADIGTCETCPVGYHGYQSYCYECSVECAACSLVSTNCSDCALGYVWNDGVCVLQTACPAACKLHCALCTDDIGCDECVDGYVIVSTDGVAADCLTEPIPILNEGGVTGSVSIIAFSIGGISVVALFYYGCLYRARGDKFNDKTKLRATTLSETEMSVFREPIVNTTLIMPLSSSSSTVAKDHAL